ncbi:MAG: SH3 domain-containing protein [Anaerolineae bacterium]|nr:SH3 domain-containing protein [Anaerolineae bacterium]
MQSRSAVIWIVRVLVVVALALPVFPALAQGPDATVVPDTLNMRYGPGAEYAVIARLVRGQELTLLARDDIPMNGIWVWARTTDGTEGWVSSDYLTVRPDLNLEMLPVRPAPADFGTPVEETPPAAEAPAPAPVQAGGFPEGTGIPAQITANVNFRGGPGTGYRAFYTLSAGTSALAKGRNAAMDWVFIGVGEQDGWVYYEFIQLTSGSLDALPVTDTVTAQTGGGQAAPAAAGGVPAPVAGGAGLAGFGYGGHVDSFAYPNLMQAAGMTWVKRQIRFNMGASGGEAAGAIQQAHANGFKILLGIVGSPGQVGAPGYFEDYARYVGEVASLGPDAIEVWNEQNIDREWPGGQIDAARYTQLLALAYNAIKSANPNVAVISGAPAPTGYFGAAGCTAEGCNDDVYVRGMAAAGAARYMDCIGAHYNEGIISPNWTSGDPRGGHYTRYFWGMVNTYSAAFGGARPICFTELGYLSPEGLGPLPGHYAWGADTSVAEQAAWLADAVRLSRSSGRVKLVIIWNVDFTTYGGDPMAGYAIVRPGGSCPACDALARVR